MTNDIVQRLLHPDFGRELRTRKEAADLIEALEAEVAAARKAEHRYLQDGSALTGRAEAAEAEVVRLREALEKIAAHGNGAGCNPASFTEIARNALWVKP
jgi:hypothetical protein